MSDRPEWVPDDVDDEDVETYLGTAGAVTDKIRWYAGVFGLPGLIACADQVEAHIAYRRDERLRGDR